MLITDPKSTAGAIFSYLVTGWLGTYKCLQLTEDSFWDYLLAPWPHEDDYWAEYIHNTQIYITRLICDIKERFEIPETEPVFKSFYLVSPPPHPGLEATLLILSDMMFLIVTG